jgi:hypothetical protein
MMIHGPSEIFMATTEGSRAKGLGILTLVTSDLDVQSATEYSRKHQIRNINITKTETSLITCEERKRERGTRNPYMRECLYRTGHALTPTDIHMLQRLDEKWLQISILEKEHLEKRLPFP